MSSQISSGLPSDMAISGSMPVSAANIQMRPEFLSEFAVVSLSVSSIFGSLIMGLILKGNGREGIKYIPFLVIISLVLFFLSEYIMNTFFSGMLSM